MLDDRARHVHTGPAALPGAIAEVEIFHVCRLVDLVDIRRARAIWRRRTASSRRCRKARSCRPRQAWAHRSAPGNLWRRTGRIRSCRSPRGGRPAGKRICAVAQNRSGTWSKGAFQGGEKARLEQHVVVQQADVRAAGARDAAVDRAREGERRRGVDHFDLRVGRGAAKRPCHRCCRYRRRRSAPAPARAMPGSWASSSSLPLRDGMTTVMPGFKRSLRLAAAIRAATVRERSHRPHNVPASTGRGIAGDPGPIRLARGRAQTPAQCVGTRHAMCRAIAGSDPGRSMKWFRFSLKARKPRGREDQRQQAHAAERDVGDQHHAGQADFVTAATPPGSGAGSRRRGG